MKRILKWFVSAEKLAKWSADGIQKAINDSKYAEQIEKYGALADKVTDVQKWLSAMLKDGKIDELEKKEIYDKLLPLYKKLFEII